MRVKTRLRPDGLAERVTFTRGRGGADVPAVAPGFRRTSLAFRRLRGATLVRAADVEVCRPRPGAAA